MGKTRRILKDRRVSRYSFDRACKRRTAKRRRMFTSRVARRWALAECVMVVIGTFARQAKAA